MTGVIDGGDLIRITVLLGGGMIVAWGCTILQDRAELYRQQRLVHGFRMCVALALINLGFVLYIMGDFIALQGTELTWRTVAALCLFTAKGWFFWEVRAATEEAERRGEKQ